MICFVFKVRRRVDGKVRPARMWSGKFQLPGDSKLTVVALGVTDKQVAQEKLRGIVRAIERERAGLSPTKKEQDAANQSVEKSIVEYIGIKRGQRCDEKYVRELELKLMRLMRACKWATLRDITASSFEAWRARQPQEKVSAKTLNEYRAALSGFCKWLESRTGNNPMRCVGSIKALGDPRRKRRAFTPDELWRLVSMAGDRGIVYLVAAFTGLRRGELERIEWRDVHVDGAQPYISVRSSISKNAKPVAQPLPPKIAAAIRQRRRVDVGPHDLVFKRLMSDMNRFRADLAAAGIAFVDGKGERADFHSLRKTFATELAKAGVATRVAMELMRHSDPILTTKIYTDAGMLPIWDAVGALPMFNDTQIDTPKLVENGQRGSAPGPFESSTRNVLGAEDKKVSQLEDGSVQKSPEFQIGSRGNNILDSVCAWCNVGHEQEKRRISSDAPRRDSLLR
jgi:integrase